MHLQWNPIDRAPTHTWVLVRRPSVTLGLAYDILVAKHDARYRPRSPWIDVGFSALTDSGMQPDAWMPLEPFMAAQMAQQAGRDTAPLPAVADVSKTHEIERMRELLNDWRNENRAYQSPECEECTIVGPLLRRTDALLGPDKFQRESRENTGPAAFDVDPSKLE